LDEYSSFKSSPTYPQFWSKLINFLAKTENLNNFNFETGKIEVIKKQSVNTPLGKLKTDRLLFDKVGFYTYDEREVAANLLNARESSVSSDAVAFTEEESQITVEGSKLKETRNFYTLFAILAALLIFGELLYIKFRGDL